MSKAESSSPDELPDLEDFEKAQHRGDFEFVEANLDRLAQLIRNYREIRNELVRLERRARRILQRHELPADRRFPDRPE
ncbi:MAG: hypothetical protein ACLFV7_04830 [Phycisphaerae bacterium]